MSESPTQADWRRWLEDQAPRFLLFARQQTRSEADAQDVVQEAVVEASQRHENGLPPAALVFATIRRRAIDLARSEDRRMGREGAVTQPGAEAWFDTGVEDRELKELMQGAMNRLPDIYREVESVNNAPVLLYTSGEHDITDDVLSQLNRNAAPPSQTTEKKDDKK